MKIQLDYRILLSLITMLLTIPPICAQQWGQDQKVINPDKDWFEYAGSSVAYENGILAVGSPDEFFWRSKVLIFEENSIRDSFEYVETLIPNDITKGDAFGADIDIHGDYMIVGAQYDQAVNGTDTFPAGAVYIYKRDNSNWNLLQKLTAPTRQPSSIFGFGKSVKFEEDFIFVSAPGEYKVEGQDTINRVGSVYVYEKDGNKDTWSYFQLLEPMDNSNNIYGLDIDASDDTLIVSFDEGFDSYHLNNQNNMWVLDQTYLEDRIGFQRFGNSVSYNGQYLFVGAPDEDTDELFSVGSVHCFGRGEEGKWSQTQMIFPNVPIGYMDFGWDLFSDSTRLIVGAPTADIPISESFVLNRAGAVYAFQKNSSSGLWYETDMKISCDLEEEDEFGTSLTFTGTDIIVGAPFEEDGIRKNDPVDYDGGGSVYIFKPCQAQNTSVQQAEHTLTAEATNVSYQWVDCDNDYALVDGATEQSFSPAESGSYAVMLTTDNGCTDTSDCFMVIASSVFESTYGHEIEVYPNPAKEDVIFDLKELKSTIQLKVLNMQGQVLDSKNYTGTQTIHYELNVPPGVYWFHIASGKGESAYLKVVKL